MRIVGVFIFFLFLYEFSVAEIKTTGDVKLKLSEQVFLVIPEACIDSTNHPSRSQKRKEKIIRAILACPLPLGFIGAHRIYMGTKPIVPIMYIATVGGCFGILPLIDFIIILKEKDPERFRNNNRIFMWTKEK